MATLPSEPASPTRRAFSRALEAEALGISPRHYRRIRAQERYGQPEWVREHPIPVEPLPDDDDERPGAEALPYVPLIYEATDGLHYRLDHDQDSVLPVCPFRCGTHNGRGWQVHHQDDRFTSLETPRHSPHKFKPRIRRKRNRDACA